jgi:hypothetical protein
VVNEVTAHLRYILAELQNVRAFMRARNFMPTNGVFANSPECVSPTGDAEIAIVDLEYKCIEYSWDRIQRSFFKGKRGDCFLFFVDRLNARLAASSEPSGTISPFAAHLQLFLRMKGSITLMNASFLSQHTGRAKLVRLALMQLAICMKEVAKASVDYTSIQRYILGKM